MPSIEDYLLDSVIYLYPSVSHARDGERAGGTGFLVGVPSNRHENLVFLYAVTNSHVVGPQEGNSPVIRLNTQDGRTDVIPFTPENWFHHPYRDDVAVCPVDLGPTHHKYSYVPRSMFITEEDITAKQTVVGDDVLFLGRFVTHEGKQRNLPTARFGNIAMLPWEPIRTERGINQQSFLVEARSLSGYSGSPVFTWDFTFGGGAGTRQLLGADCGHLRDFKRVVGKDGKPLEDEWYVEQNSGMMIVVPAWKLAELLETEELSAMREEEEREHERLSRGVALDVASSEAPQEEGEGLTRDQFFDALRKAARPIRRSPDEEGS